MNSGAKDKAVGEMQDIQAIHSQSVQKIETQAKKYLRKYAHRGTRVTIVKAKAFFSDIGTV